MRRRLVLWGPVVAYMGMIFLLSAQPSLPALPARLSDKLAHALTYAGLGLLAFRATSGAAVAGLTAGAAGRAWIITAVYAVTDEYHQALVPGRRPELGDWVADVLGAALAVAGLWAWGIIRRSRQGRTTSSAR